MTKFSRTQPVPWSGIAANTLMAGGFVQLVQMGLTRTQLPMSWIAWLCHAIVILGIHGLIAVLLAGRAQNRAWAGALFLTPVTLAGLPFSVSRWGSISYLLWFLVFVVALFAWTKLSRGHGRVMVCAFLGAAAGAFLAGPFALTTRLASIPLLLVSFLSSASRKQADEASLMRAIPAVLIATALFAGSWWLAPVQAPSILIPRDGGVPSVDPWCEQSPHLCRDITATVGLSRADRPVVLIVLDTVRADHLSAYGYERETMPQLRAMLDEQELVAFDSYANAPSSLSTHASLFTGLYPTRHFAHKPFIDDPDPPAYAYPLPLSIPTLAELLRGHGYRTVGVSGNYGPLGSGKGLDRGFEQYVAHPDPTYELKHATPWRFAFPSSEPLRFLDRIWPFSQVEYFSEGVSYMRARQITDRAIEAIHELDDEPFFLFVNFFDAHHPYRPPWSHMDSFEGRDGGQELGGIDQTAAFEIQSGQRSASQAEIDHLHALYDSELSYLDVELARLMDYLRDHPRWDDMRILITSDHGEAFGEHDLFEHSISLYDPMIRVPFMVKFSPQERAAFLKRSGRPDFERTMQSVDAFPILLQAAGAEIPEGIDGKTWYPLEGPEPPVFSWAYKSINRSTIFSKFDRELRAVVVDGWKLIESTNGEIELFDLVNDPEESVNRASEQLERVETMRALLGPRVGYASMPTEGRYVESDEGLERLRALGYAQ